MAEIDHCHGLVRAFVDSNPLSTVTMAIECTSIILAFKIADIRTYSTFAGRYAIDLSSVIVMECTIETWRLLIGKSSFQIETASFESQSIMFLFVSFENYSR
jgi:hypothetical protein